MSAVDLLDSKHVVYTVLGLLPNLFIILWAIARLSRDVRILYAKLSLIEADMRVVDQGLNQVSEQSRQTLAKVEGKPNTPPPEIKGAPGSSGGLF